jgi:hypothetical protein
MRKKDATTKRKGLRKISLMKKEATPKMHEAKKKASDDKEEPQT